MLIRQPFYVILDKLSVSLALSFILCFILICSFLRLAFQVHFMSFLIYSFSINFYLIFFIKGQNKKHKVVRPLYSHISHLHNRKVIIKHRHTKHMQLKHTLTALTPTLCSVLRNIKTYQNIDFSLLWKKYDHG